MSKKRKQLWRIKEELENELKILKRGKLETLAIIATMLKIGIKKGGFTKVPSPIMKTAQIVNEGKHSPSMVDHVLRELLKHDSKIIKPVEVDSPYDEGKDSQFTEEGNEIIAHDIEVYNKLDKHNLLKESERILVQIIDERLKKFYVF